MALAWFQLPQAQNLIENLDPRQLKIVAGGNGYCWKVPEGIENEVDRLLDFCTNKEVGYTFDDSSGEERERWIHAYEAQAPLSAFLHAKFGDPNVYLNRNVPIPEANRMFQSDPLYPLRIREEQIKELQDKLGEGGK